MLGQVAAFFAIFCAFVLLPAVVLGWSVASKWLDLQQEMLQLEREKVRLLAQRAEIDSTPADFAPGSAAGPTVADGSVTAATGPRPDPGRPSLPRLSVLPYGFEESETEQRRI